MIWNAGRSSYYLKAPEFIKGTPNCQPFLLLVHGNLSQLRVAEAMRLSTYSFVSGPRLFAPTEIFLLNEHGSLANASTQVIELGASHISLTIHIHLGNTW